ncbi:MAG: anthranilate synthase component I family protein [Nitrospirae bacterium]|nr:anthranilate synthase component I family protein [Candidatus Troglogloeales bacterium]MBI3598460.1 anthranilate synthase component I family protein [Candidatus Troglogloeales bacterium]
MKLQSPFLFEGATNGWFNGQYSLIGRSSFAVFKSRGPTASFEFNKADGAAAQYTYRNQDPLSILQTWLNRFRPPQDLNHSEIPLGAGAAIGFISYEWDVYFLFVNCFLLYDHTKPLIHIVYNPAPLIEIGWPEALAYETGRHEIEAIEKAIMSVEVKSNEAYFPSSVEMTGNLSEGEYIAMVLRAKEYIAAGEIFQANLSHRFSAPFSGDSIFPLYERLKKINPSPFSAYINMGGVEIASGSPERLVRVKNGLIETRPIAGTCPRGQNLAEDQEKIAALYGSHKERAEHLMLVDLERNDIGKVARFGTVQVELFMALEQYSHVFHLVSNIVGMLRESVLAADVLRAVFPGGTITGVPKIHCMQIISELEGQTRGLYTGSIGMIDFSGEMDCNIVIRSFIRQGRELSFQVGAGIVADSDPKMEYQETLQKAAALMKVLRWQ